MPQERWQIEFTDGMPTNLPYYPMYVYDFDEDPKVLAMNLSEVGLYQLALNEAWKRGSIPDDPTALANLIRRKPAEVKRAWLKVRTCWIENGTPGRLVNPRMEKERDIANKRQNQAYLAGKASASVRKQTKADERTLVQYASDSGSVSGSGLKISTPEESSTRARGIDAQDQMRMWCNHRGFAKPSRGQRQRVLERMDQIDITEQENAAALDGYFLSDWAKENRYPIWGFLKDPHSWIDRYERSVPPRRGGMVVSVATPSPAAQDLQDSEIPEIAAKWNLIPKTTKVRVWPMDSKSMAAYNAAVGEKKFIEHYDDILSASSDLLERGGDKAACLNFVWMLNNWRKILNGGCSWMVAKFDQPRKMTVEDHNNAVAAEYLAKLAAEESAQNG